MLVPTVDGVAHVEGPQDFQFRHFPEGMEANQNNSFCVFSDEMRRNRNKIVHAQGVHAKVKWTPVEGNKYTGMYATGSDSVIMRLSETQNLTKYSTGLLPSVAFKFLRDGKKSADIVAMPSFEPTKSWNFFEPAMNTRVEPITEESNKCVFDTLIASLQVAANSVFSCGLGHVADVNSDGTKLENADVVTPFELSFVPADELKAKIPAERQYVDDVVVQWYDQVMAAASKGDKLFDVMAYDSINDPLVTPKPWTKIAEITLDSDMHTSLFGDERLFFRHHRTKFDSKYWSKKVRKAWWAGDIDVIRERHGDHIWSRPTPAGWPRDDNCEAEKLIEKTIEETGCPFAWFFSDDPAIYDTYRIKE